MYTSHFTKDLNVKLYQYEEDTQILYSFLPEKVNIANYALWSRRKKYHNFEKVLQLKINNTCLNFKKSAKTFGVEKDTSKSNFIYCDVL